MFANQTFGKADKKESKTDSTYFTSLCLFLKYDFFKIKYCLYKGSNEQPNHRSPVDDHSTSSPPK